MGQTALIVLLLLATGVAVLAVQNAGPVTVRFGFWSLELSLVVVILVAAPLGAVMASLVSLPGWFRDRRTLRQQARELETLRAPRTPAPSSASPAASAPQQPLVFAFIFPLMAQLNKIPVPLAYEGKIQIGKLWTGNDDFPYTTNFGYIGYMDYPGGSEDYYVSLFSYPFRKYGYSAEYCGRSGCQHLFRQRGKYLWFAAG